MYAAFLPRLVTAWTALALIILAACTPKPNAPADGRGPNAQPSSMPAEQDLHAGDYLAEWRVIDSLEQQGLFKSALERVEELYNRARGDRKAPQIIKTLLYRGKYTTQLEEDGIVRAIQSMETELDTPPLSAMPEARAVLHTVLGELYATYLQNRAWQIRQRTPLADGETGDLLTWSAEQIERRALAHYRASLEPAAALRNTPVEAFDDITTAGVADTVTGPLRPSLYDLLAHRALDYFANERSFLTEPTYAFVLEQPVVLARADEFVRANITTPDTTSHKWLAVQLFQELLRRHLDDEDPSARIDADLRRLQFARSNAVLDDKDARYEEALLYLHKQYYDHPSDLEIVALLAQLWIEQDQALAPAPGQGGPAPGLLKRAVTELEDVLRRHGTGAGNDLPAAAMARMLLKDLKGPQVQIQAEQINVPDRALLLHAQVRNLGTVYTRVVALPNDDVTSFNRMPYEKRLPYLLGRRTVQQRTWSIEDPRDYRYHRTELYLEALPGGRYAVLLSPTADFDDTKAPVSYAVFAVSNLTLVPFAENGVTRFAVVHRQTGAPLPGVRLDFYQWDYGRERRDPIGNTTTDANGLAQPGGMRERYNIFTRATLGADTLWLDDRFYFGAERPEYEREPRRTVQFFTDRALYRPGQQIYFKGVLLQHGKDRVPKIAPNEAVSVSFYDVNGQKKQTLQLRSNAFGTFNGVFTAPTGGLTGAMSIQAEGGASGAVQISVEEYKRPKFEVTFQPVEGAYRLGEKVTVKGKAQSYAGSTVGDAKLRYRVVRQARYPFFDFGFWGSPRIWPPAAPPAEIANGVATTGDDGTFTVTFTAVPDRGTDPKHKPVFDYVVHVDVTDINGETRSAETSVSVGYVALQVELGVTADMPIDSLRRVVIQTTNLAGQFQPAGGIIRMYPLIEPGTFFKKRYWEKPDVYTIGEAEYRRLFPDIAVGDDDDPAKWSRGPLAHTVEFSTSAAKTVDLHGGQVQPGFYLVTLTTRDAFGTEVQLERVVHVWSPAQPVTRFYEPAAIRDKTTMAVGETARIWFGGRPAPLYVFYAREHDRRLANPRWLTVNGAEKVEFPITEADRGGVHAHWFTVIGNRLYGAAPVSFDVPWSNKQLTITYETFRDKLLPGQQEEWRLRISGPNKEKVAAELAAGLYDASLDQFLPHQWAGIAYPANYTTINWMRYAAAFEAVGGEMFYRPVEQAEPFRERTYRQLNWFGFPLFGSRIMMDAVGGAVRSKARREMAEEAVMAPAPAAPAGAVETAADAAANQQAGDGRDNYKRPEAHDYLRDSATRSAPPVSIRQNLNETVFFFPELRTDANGDVILKFKMNEALTRWKLLTFAHTKELQYAVSSREVVTQKELMVLPNAPRFLRQGDRLTFAAKVSNLSPQALQGSATLTLLDADSEQPLDKAFGLTTVKVPFQAVAGQSAAVNWTLTVPEDFSGAVTYRVVAQAGAFSDGEENTLPVVSNRMLVTETMPLAVRGGQTKTFNFENLRNPSKTLTPERYTVEFTSNPAWLTVQSLPYLMEFPHECSEQIFNRMYANTLASHVTAKMPAIRKMYDRQKAAGTLKSNLTRNQELKTALLEETPWVLDAQSEEQQQRNIALLFDLNRMADEQQRAIGQLAAQQLGNGAWPWFAGGPDNWYITQYIVTGFGHLKHLGVALPFEEGSGGASNEMLDKALSYCDRKVEEAYKRLENDVQHNRAKWDDDHLDGLIIQYLYAKSFFPIDRPSKVHAYYLNQAEKYWLNKGLYQEGLLALALHRNGRPEAAQRIVASLRERALQKEELGMYWPFQWGYYWYQLPVETQALMVEVFDEVAGDARAVEELRIWLLKNKQTNRWESTKATAEAVYAFLLRGDNWLQNSKPVAVKLGNTTLKPTGYEPGTGYFKESWAGKDIKPAWSAIEVQNPNTNIAWGAAYFQYFEDLDNIKDFQKTPLTIVKQLFREEDSPSGPKLTPVAAAAALKPGDRLRVRVELRSDRAMEFIHLKDMRASGLEPTNVLSGYRYQDGLGYYESTRDLATHFFIDYLPRGTFVFEYPLVVSLRGDFSNGITTAQCMYAPEFSSHSKGVRVRVE